MISTPTCHNEKVGVHDLNAQVQNEKVGVHGLNAQVRNEKVGVHDLNPNMSEQQPRGHSLQPLGAWYFLGDFTTQPNLRRIVRKNPESYREYGAGPGLDKPYKSGRSRVTHLFPLTL
ncbi:MAG: hypothetical protein HUU55_19920 [Myxococcales bacterium]|nr:hypothetical protein [Myxococcales bacterium]